MGLAEGILKVKAACLMAWMEARMRGPLAAALLTCLLRLSPTSPHPHSSHPTPS